MLADEPLELSQPRHDSDMRHDRARVDVLSRETIPSNRETPRMCCSASREWCNHLPVQLQHVSQFLEGLVSSGEVEETALKNFKQVGINVFHGTTHDNRQPR